MSFGRRTKYFFVSSRHFFFLNKTSNCSDRMQAFTKPESDLDLYLKPNPGYIDAMSNAIWLLVARNGKWMYTHTVRRKEGGEIVETRSVELQGRSVRRSKASDMGEPYSQTNRLTENQANRQTNKQTVLHNTVQMLTIVIHHVCWQGA